MAGSALAEVIMANLEFKALAELPEDVLVERAKAEDKDAYRVLVERYQQRIFAIAYEIVKNREDAEDVAQESFVKAYLALRTFKGDSSFYTWLYRIAHHMALDVRRRIMRRREDSLEAPAANGSEIGTNISSNRTNDNPHKVAVNRQTAERIKQVFGEISEEHRSVVVLREIDGLSYDEIAKVTGVSKGTVMSRLFYARKKLQQALLEFVQ